MKSLLPCLKERKRFVVYQILSEHNFTALEADKAISEATKDYLGILGLSKAGITHLKERYNNNKGIIRVNNKFVDEVKASLTLIKMIDKKKATVRSLGVSGILKKADDKFLKGGLS